MQEGVWFDASSRRCYPFGMKMPKEVLDAFREWGRQGGLKGGKARMNGLSKEEKSALGRDAARKRWRRAKTKAKSR
jgi:hypothetical protein